MKKEHGRAGSLAPLLSRMIAGSRGQPSEYIYSLPTMPLKCQPCEPSYILQHLQYSVPRGVGPFRQARRGLRDESACVLPGAGIRRGPGVDLPESRNRGQGTNPGGCGENVGMACVPAGLASFAVTINPALVVIPTGNPGKSITTPRFLHEVQVRTRTLWPARA
jgi:hypothetical protein